MDIKGKKAVMTWLRLDYIGGNNYLHQPAPSLGFWCFYCPLGGGGAITNILANTHRREHWKTAFESSPKSFESTLLIFGSGQNWSHERLNFPKTASFLEIPRLSQKVKIARTKEHTDTFQKPWTVLGNGVFAFRFRSIPWSPEVSKAQNGRISATVFAYL